MALLTEKQYRLNVFYHYKDKGYYRVIKMLNLKMVEFGDWHHWGDIHGNVLELGLTTPEIVIRTGVKKTIDDIYFNAGINTLLDSCHGRYIQYTRYWKKQNKDRTAYFAFYNGRSFKVFNRKLELIIPLHMRLDTLKDMCNTPVVSDDKRLYGRPLNDSTISEIKERIKKWQVK